MGIALLTKPKVVSDILQTLKRNLNIPITCKIRLLSTTKETLQLCRVLESTGISAIGIHARMTADRPYHTAIVCVYMCVCVCCVRCVVCVLCVCVCV